ncbi:hypothetical protein GCM10009654_47250 [Streptomyces hebeiensis]|uniref:Small hydrophobic protein n=1 Tax=Streptomyces hebeiensis TaxID=229486 RepID=A0ABP4FPR6_9ACTN
MTERPAQDPAVPGSAPGGPVPSVPPPAAGGEQTMREEKSFPRGLVIRLFAYLIAGHLFAGFLYLLFHLGAGQ